MKEDSHCILLECFLVLNYGQTISHIYHHKILFGSQHDIYLIFLVFQLFQSVISFKLLKAHTFIQHLDDTQFLIST